MEKYKAFIVLKISSYFQNLVINYSCSASTSHLGILQCILVCEGGTCGLKYCRYLHYIRNRADGSQSGREHYNSNPYPQNLGILA